MLELLIFIKTARFGLFFLVRVLLFSVIRQGKQGFIQSDSPPILQRLGLEHDAWGILTTEFEDRFNHWVGSERIVKQVCETHNYSRPPPTSNHKALLG